MCECQALETFRFLEEGYSEEMLTDVLTAIELPTQLITFNLNPKAELTHGKT
jgi:hypothetical protein